MCTCLEKLVISHTKGNLCITKHELTERPKGAFLTSRIIQTSWKINPNILSNQSLSLLHTFHGVRS